MAVIAENIQQGLFERIVWKPQTKAEIVIRGLGHRVVAKSDELLCAKYVFTTMLAITRACTLLMQLLLQLSKPTA